MKASATPSWHQVRRLLAVRLDNLGDVLMSTPALAAVRDSLPGVQVTLLTSPAGALVAPHLAMVDDVWSYRVPWMQPGACVRPNAALGADEAALIERIAAGRFDAAIVFTVCTQSALPAALLCRMAGVPLRLAHCRENPYGLLTDWVRETDEVVPGLAPQAQARLVRHEVERQLSLVDAVGYRTRDDRLRFHVRPQDRQSLAALLQEAGLAPELPYAVLHPGASAASRRWPAERFGQAAAALAAQGLAVVFSGGPEDAALVEAAHAAATERPRPALPMVSLAGRLHLGELAALIERARVLVANNSGPAHIAAALGTPVVNLYALTNPQHRPWRVEARVLNHDVPCRWCLKSTCPQGHHDCLQRVEAPQVVEAVIDLVRPPKREAA